MEYKYKPKTAEEAAKIEQLLRETGVTFGVLEDHTETGISVLTPCCTFHEWAFSLITQASKAER